ncbi:MAG: hypothetical protein HC941_29405 [Microcoleus sp. SU_5_3]|nr:hypothetical protein [Microcoleus sp. SU_5_3]
MNFDADRHIEGVPAGIEDVMSCVESILGDTWQKTGFGCLEIESERVKNGKIRVVVKGSTYYRYVITDAEVKKWLSGK